MDFSLTEERQMLQDTLRRFLSKAGDTASDALWAQLAELGVVGSVFTEQQGGYGGSGFDLSVVFEEIGRAGIQVPLLSSAVLAGGLLAARGDEQQRGLLEPLIAGELQLAFAHSEPGSRYELNRVGTTATAQGDGYRLNGHKSVVLNADQAQKIVVSARTQGQADDEQGISLFLLDRDAPGLRRRDYQTIDGVGAAELYFEDCDLPASALLGEAHTAYAAIEQHVAQACAALCAEALGNMETCLSLTVEYLKTRQQFGRPVAKFQALQHRMADIAIEIEQARSATINVCGHLGHERHERERQVSAAKNLIGRIARLVAEESIQLHGAIGMTAEYAVGSIAKRLLMIDHEWGDVEHHLERFIEFSSAPA